MDMKRILLATALAAGTGFAQEAADEAPAADGGDAAVATNAAPARIAAFTTLPLCRLVEGEVQACKVGGEWAAAEEGRFYPLGTSFRTGEDGRLVLAFGPESLVSIGPKASFSTRAQELGQASRSIMLQDGTVELSLPDNLPEGAFFVTASGFTVKNPAGKSKYDYVDKGDGEEVRVRCVTGSMSMEGRHFDIPAMRSANELVIRTSHDHLTTALYGTSGDYVVRLDQGLRIRGEIGDDGQMKDVEEKGLLEWHLSPATKVIINRSVPAIGERMSVHTMAFDAAGERKSECAFCEGRAEVNSGEMVLSGKLDKDEIAKRAAEATETTAVEAEDAPAEAEASADSTSNENEE